jgi:uncharacterized membrane protein YeaQ/YmgE (transglycosylase-associated protein family)
VLLIGILLFGLVVGAAAQWILGFERDGVDWTMALAAGLGGSFVGGTVSSLLAGDGFALRPSGLIGSFLGAVVVTALARKLQWGRSSR